MSDVAGNEGISSVITVAAWSETTAPTVTLAYAPATGTSGSFTVTAVDTQSGVPDGTNVYLDIDVS